jgi:cysteine desulfurase
MAQRAYLDWNATAPLRPEARAAMLGACDLVGNASSIHREGRAARQAVEVARRSVAELIGADPRNVVFTSGGTEANALALTPAIEVDGDRAPRDRLLMSAIEHPSVRAGGEFAPDRIEEVPVGEDGRVDLTALERRLTVLAGQGARPLVSLMLANNETGVIQPVAAAAELVHRAGGLLHVDAVQGAGKIPFNINDLGADLVTLSAHKLGGPKGVGALIKRDEALHLPHPLIRGGGQERGARAGTENVPGIAGFGAAAEAARSTAAEEAARVTALRDRIEAGVLAVSSSTVIFGRAAQRLPNTTLFAMPGMKAETALIALDLDGVAVSAGSACSSGKVAASHVLEAMGIAPELARGAIRVSVGFSTSDEEVDCFLAAWKKLVSTLLKGTHGIAA